jgi:hypothetical protein
VTHGTTIGWGKMTGGWEGTHRAYIWLAIERKFEPFGSSASIHRWASHSVGNIISGYSVATGGGKWPS